MRCVTLNWIVAFAACASTFVTAAPTLSSPLADQLPPVARVNEQFVFQLLPSTFKSTDASLNYTTSTLPSWLAFDSPTLTFSGKPSKNDAGQSPVQLTATDSTGTATSNFSLIVSQNAEPQVHLSYAAQIADPASRDFASVQVAPGNNSITVPPFWSFSIGWNGETFRPASSGQRLYYMARLKEGGAIPSWLQFSNTTSTFNGVAPGNGSYTVVVTGTDYWGYRAAETEFELSVGTGQPIEVANWTDISTVSRAAVNYTFDTSRVHVNGKAASASEVVITPDLSNSKWLSFDSHANTITGTTPDSLVNGSAAAMVIPVKVSSTNASNTLTYSSFVKLNVLPYYFTNFTLPDLSVTAGQSFTYDVSPYVRDKSANISASVVPKDAAAWLLYYPEVRSLVGTPPTNISYQSLNVAFLGDVNGTIGTTNLNVSIANVQGPQGTGEATPVPEASVHHGLSKTGKIIVGVCVGLGLPLLILLALLLLLCCRRRKQQQKQDEAYVHSRYSSGAPNTPGNKSIDTEATLTRTPVDAKVGKFDDGTEKPRRMGGIAGLFGFSDSEKDKEIVEDEKITAFDNGEFTGRPEIISVRGARPSDDTTLTQSAITRQSVTSDERASWESAASFHWSAEDEYLAPLPISEIGNLSSSDGASTATPVTTPTVAAVRAEADSNVPRPLPGFYPRFPRHMRPGDPAPFISSDNVSRSFSEFHDTSRRSLDSFADSGSMLTSSAFGTNSGLGFSSGSGSEGRFDNIGSSGSLWSVGHGVSRPGMNHFASSNGVDRFASSGMGTSGTFSSEGGPVVVGTAERQSLETRRSEVHRVPATLAVPAPVATARSRSVTPTNAGPPFAGTAFTAGPFAGRDEFSSPDVNGSPASARTGIATEGSPSRRLSSSRRTMARVHADRARAVSAASGISGTSGEESIDGEPIQFWDSSPRPGSHAS